MVLYKWWAYMRYGSGMGFKWFFVYAGILGALTLFTVQLRNRVECAKDERDFCNILLATWAAPMLVLTFALLILERY